MTDNNASNACSVADTHSSVTSGKITNTSSDNSQQFIVAGNADNMPLYRSSQSVADDEEFYEDIETVTPWRRDKHVLKVRNIHAYIYSMFEDIEPTELNIDLNITSYETLLQA